MVKIYTDAAFDPSTKQAAAVVHFYHEQQLFQYHLNLEKVMDNHEAEFQAMILALEKLIALQLNSGLCQIFSDSKIVIQSIEKRYVKDIIYRQHLERILELNAQFELQFFQWIPEKENLAADQYAKSILQRMKK